MWEGLGRGQGCLQPFPAFRGSRNVLAHFGVLKGHVEKKKYLESFGNVDHRENIIEGPG